MSEILLTLLTWPLALFALCIFGFLPGLLARVIALSFRKGDPRREEIIAEVYAVPRWERPFWVAEQLERALSEGAWDRIYDFADGRIFNRWSLGDAISQNVAYPDTFWVPSPEEIAELRPHDRVRLMFDAKGWTHGLGGCSGERMWVQITKINGDKFEGKLNNVPTIWNHLNYGAKIKFSNRHIIDYKYCEGEEPRAQLGLVT